MDFVPEFSQSAYYELRVRGLLSQQAASWFSGMEIVVDETINPSQTVIKGFMIDQAALHGLISRIRDLGLTLVSVNQIARKDDDEQSG